MGVGMARISMDHRHGLSMEQSREKLADLSKKLEEKYHLSFSWVGDSVDIKGPGVKGNLALSEGCISGFLDVPFFLKGKVERALEEKLSQEFPE
jgi:putative polyhydroxyalkanoate system protein